MGKKTMAEIYRGNKKHHRVVIEILQNGTIMSEHGDVLDPLTLRLTPAERREFDQIAIGSGYRVRADGTLVIFKEQS